MPRAERIKVIYLSIYHSIDWTEDSLDIVFRWLVCHGRELSESGAKLPMDEPIPDAHHFPYTECGAGIPRPAC